MRVEKKHRQEDEWERRKGELREGRRRDRRESRVQREDGKKEEEKINDTDDEGFATVRARANFAP